MDKRQEKLKYLDNILQPRDPKETSRLYDDWANNYEQDIHFIEYYGAEKAVNAFLELNLPKEIRILDIASGCGHLAERLKLNGYTNIDGIDGSQEMLEIAKQKNCYKSLINSFVYKDKRLPIEDEVYDAAIMAGCLCPGHVSFESFPQIIRVVKKGGIICWSMAPPEDYEERDELFSDGKFGKFVEMLCKQNKWKPISGFPKRCEDYLRGENGLVYAMKVM